MQKPMNVEFLDAPHILNDGFSENTLVIGVFNNGIPTAAGTSADDIKLKKDIPMFIWFITDDQPSGATAPARPWALTSLDRLKTLANKVSVNQGGWTCEFHNDVAGRPDLKGFKLTPSDDVVLKPGKFLTITLTGIVSGMPSGPTNAFFSYSSDEVEHKVAFGPVQKLPMIARGLSPQAGASPAMAFSYPALPPGAILSMGEGATKGDFVGVGYLDKRLRFHVPTRQHHDFYIGGDNNNPWGARLLNVNYNGIHVMPDNKLSASRMPQEGLLSFGADGEYQIVHKGIGHFGRPTIALHAGSSNAVGFYTSNLTPMLEVEGGSGNTYVKGSLKVAQAPLRANQISNIIRFGTDGNYQIVHKPKGYFGKPTLALHADAADALGFYSDNMTPLLEVEASTGNVYIKGDTQISQKLTVSQDLSVNGKMLVNGVSPVIFKILQTGKLTNNDQYNHSALINTGLNKNNYVGIVGGFSIDSYDARDDDKGKMSVLIYGPENSDNLHLEVKIYADQAVDNVVVHALFIRKEWVDYQRW